MDELVTSTILLNKEFFVQEREGFYADWTIAFWRELFQNSVDAGSTKIDIQLDDAPARGSFDKTGSADRTVTNVVFTDNGHGMTAEVLDQVYFAMGKSSKDKHDNSTVGGFGRARIMTCFSQERYSIITKDRFVMGDGARFTNHSLDDVHSILGGVARRLEAADNADGGASVSLWGINNDLAHIKAAIEAGGFDGCRVEVDLDKVGISRWSRKGTVENMADALKRYLGESQMSCEVTVNGKSPEEYFHIDYKEGKLQARRGPVRKTLYVPDSAGEPEAFATVHTSEGKKAGYKGSLIIRVAGAAMYRKEITALESQVILEIDPVHSRNALNSNRDGLKGRYAEEVEKLINSLVVDTLSALRSKSAKVTEIPGEKGLIRSKAIDFQRSVTESVEPGMARELLVGSRTPGQRFRVGSIEALFPITGLHQDVLKKFVKATYNGDSFLNEYLRGDYNEGDELHKQLQTIREALYREERSVSWLLENAEDLAKDWIISILVARVSADEAKAREEADQRIRGTHDIHIVMETTNEKTRAFARRNHPENWDASSGRGKQAKTMLMMWTAACNAYVRSLYRLRPALPEITWSTGMLYALPEVQYEGDISRENGSPAGCVPIGPDSYRLLINPVNADGTLRYRLTDENDVRRMASYAAHEVAHMVEIPHNETFALIYTHLMAETDTRQVFREMKVEAAAVTAAYSKGRSRVQAMDDEGGIRPAQRLLALSNGNREDLATQSMVDAGDGTWTVDNDEAYQRTLGNETDNEPRRSAGMTF